MTTHSRPAGIALVLLLWMAAVSAWANRPLSPEPDREGDSGSVVFEAELDRHSVYVQGQIVFTLRVLGALSIAPGGAAEPEVEQAVVRSLGIRSYRRTSGGHSQLVHEIRYAIFPERSGTLEIPAQKFAARQGIAPPGSTGNRGGRLIRHTTVPTRVEVLPRHPEFPTGTWLPAHGLTLEEQWSTPPRQLRLGESTTHTLRIIAAGLQGSQIPPLQFPATAALSYYPDRPFIKDSVTADGLVGIREQSAELVPTRQGMWRLPAISIPWWDSEAGEVRHAVLPAREIEVLPGKLPSGLRSGSGKTIEAPDDNSAHWRFAAVAAGLGWLLTLAWVLYRRLLVG